MKAPFDLAADLDTPVSAFLKLRDLQPRFLLESVEGGERVGRYSFIGFGDALVVRLDDDGFRIGDALHPVPTSRQEFLDRLREALAQAPVLLPEAGLPFSGGLVGAMAYDIVRRFEAVGDQAVGIGHPELSCLATDSLLVFDHATRRAAVLHAGPEGDRLAIRAKVVDALAGPVPPAAGGERFVGPGVPTLDEGDYVEAVERIQAHIHEGDVYQLVMSVGLQGRTNVPPFEAYRALRLLNPSPYMYFFDDGALQVVGSSPEALVKLRGREATLRPIAGTRPRGDDERSDVALEKELLADPKEAAEHVMLVDLARNDLGRVAVAGSVHVHPSRIIERYSHVMHIVSGVQGVLRPDADAFDLFAATFPAGTVVGAPKVRAMQLIDALEPVGRGLYAGTVGYFGHGDVMDQAIAIRTMVFQDGTYRVQAGAGVVADSVPHKEYAECMAKAAAARAALELAKEGL